MQVSGHRFIGAILLIAGTTIGAGMLALPIMTAEAGFIPAVLLYILYWILTLFSALFFLEVTLWFKKEVNLVSMAERTLGIFGKAVTWSLYLFLLYALTTAYLAGSAPLIVAAFNIIGIHLPDWVGATPLIALFGVFIYVGVAAVDKLNRWMMAALGLTFLVIITTLIGHVKASNLTHIEFSALPPALAVVATSFGFHIIIPSLTTYLQRDIKALKKAIFIGSLIALTVYIVWEWLVLSVVPTTGEGLQTLELESRGNAALLLAQASNNPIIVSLIQCFAFFLIVTSFLGVSLSLFDFLADGLKIPKTKVGKGGLFLLTFLPPLVITWYNPDIFLKALEYAGAFGVVGLLVLMPACMVLAGRRSHPDASYIVKGGKWLPRTMIILSAVLMLRELINLF